MTIKPPHATTVRTDSDLHRLWASLMGPGGFGQRALWLLFLDGDGHPLPVIVPIEPIEAEPDALFVRNLTRIVDGLVASGEAHSVAMLLSRPGSDRMTASDRRWARALSSRPSTWPIHLATYERIQVFAADDLIAAS